MEDALFNCRLGNISSTWVERLELFGQEFCCCTQNALNKQAVLAILNLMKLRAYEVLKKGAKEAKEANRDVVETLNDS